ncbi:MAG TPA: hypothetical protein VGE70_10220 [Burkholderiaceae bacterium]
MIYAKTELGQLALRDRTVAITPRQRSAFILLDGKHELAEILRSTAGIGVSEQDIAHLVDLGLIRPVAAAPVQQVIAPAAVAQQAPAADAPAMPADHPDERYLRAYPVATRLTAELGLRGFRLNLAVERAGSYSELLGVLPKIREAVGPEKFQVLEDLVRH